MSYQLAGSGQALPAWPDQSEAYYKRACALKDEGRLAEALAAFDNAIALKPDYAQAHNGRGIVLAHVSRLAEAAGSFDRAIALKPDYAEAHNNRALVLQDLGQLEEALISLDRAIALQPDNARAHNNRGVVLHGLMHDDEALASHDKAIALKPEYAEAHYNRGIVLRELDRLDDALASFDRAIALKRDYAAAHNNRGTVLLDLGRLEEAVAAFDAAIALTGGFAEASVNKSYCLLQMGRFEEGWRLHEWRKKTERPVGHRSFSQPPWLGNEDITNKTVFVHWEQGFGDTLQFCRYGRLLRARGANVVMSVQEPLYRLLSHSMPDIRFLKDDVVPAAFDYHCALMSLPLAFGTTLQNVPAAVPYLFADDEGRKTWEDRMPTPSKPRVGLAWSGNAKHKNDINRSVGLATLAPILGYRCALGFVAERDWRHRSPAAGELSSHFPLRQAAERFFRHGSADRRYGFGHHRRHERRASCQRDGKAGVDVVGIQGGLAMAARRRRLPVVSDGPVVSAANAACLGWRRQARRCGARGFCELSITP